MNLVSLTVKMMLNTTGQWLAKAEFVAQLQAGGLLGPALLDQLARAHDELAELDRLRAAATASLRALIDEATRLDGVHDRKARALHFHLRGLIEGSDDPERVALYRRLEVLLFADGLRVIQLSYIEEGGAAVSLERSVRPEDWAALAEIQVGEQTLAQLLSAWLKAGHELGAAVRSRKELEASLAKDGSESEKLSIRRGRVRWIRAVRGLLWGIETAEELASLDEGVRAALKHALAVSRRAGAQAGGAGGVDETEAEQDAGAPDDSPEL